MPEVGKIYSTIICRDRLGTYELGGSFVYRSGHWWNTGSLPAVRIVVEVVKWKE